MLEPGDIEYSVKNDHKCVIDNDFWNEFVEQTEPLVEEYYS